MNILVTGANGQLGMSIKKIVGDSSHNFFFVSHTELDITSECAVNEYIHKNNINVIINCAAYTNVDKAESDKFNCENVNIYGVNILANAINKFGGYLVHISTDYVFDGTQNIPYKETDTPNPVSVYGKSKYIGETMIKSNKNIIIRTSWLYSEFGKNFYKSMLKYTNERSELKVVFDQIGTPTYAGDLAEVIVNNIIEHPIFGLYHFSNEGVCSWYDFTKEIASLTNHNNCNIIPIRSNEYPTPVTRPSYSVFDKHKIKSTYNITIPYWKDSLQKCIDSSYE